MKNITRRTDCLACKRCCYFPEKEKYLSPFFYGKEISKEIKNKLVKNKRNNFWQAKLVKSSIYKSLSRCIFLNEKSYKCKIYNKRPLDCSTWPFVIGWDKRKKNIYLWIVNKKMCPVVKNVNEIKKSKIVNKILARLKKDKFFEDIKSEKRYLWLYKNYQIKLRKIN